MECNYYLWVCWGLWQEVNAVGALGMENFVDIRHSALLTWASLE